MAYQPNIPTGSVPLNQDYLNLKGNFQSIDSQFLVDHVPLTSVTPLTDPNGYHQFVHLVPFSTTTSNPPNNYPATTVPAATPGFGQLFSAEIADGFSTDTSLYFLSGGGRLTQLTRNFTIAPNSNGNTFLPGGLVIQWGSGSGTITFPRAFKGSPSFPFPVITFSPTGTSGTSVPTITSAPSLTAFTVAASATGFYWMAIGM